MRVDRGRFAVSAGMTPPHHTATGRFPDCCAVFAGPVCLFTFIVIINRVLGLAGVGWWGRVCLSVCVCVGGGGSVCLSVTVCVRVYAWCVWTK